MKKIRLETEFTVSDDVDEENIRHIVGQFFADMVETDRFIDARIVDGESISDEQKAAIKNSLSEIDEDALESIESFIDEYTEE